MARLNFVGAVILGLGLMLGATSAVAQNTPPADRTEKQMDTQHAMHTWGEFLGKHPELREQLNKNPKLVNDPAFQSQHPDLQKFMSDHPGISDGLKKNPNAMMKRERKYARSKHAGERHPQRNRERQ